MKIIILEENFNNTTEFHTVPDDIFNLMKSRRYSEEANRERMAIFRGKDGNEYLIVKEINSSIFEVYDVRHLRSYLLNRDGNFYQPVGRAIFDVNYMEKYFTGYSSNESIFVEPKYRRLGIASAITDFAENFYKFKYRPSKLLSPEMTEFVKQRKHISEGLSDQKTLILYHGTDKIFKNFDLKYFNTGSADNGWLGYGIYLTNDYEYAESYGDVLECKVQLYKPYVINDFSYSVSPNKLAKELGVDNAIGITKVLTERGFDSVLLEYEDDFSKDIFTEVCVFNTNNISIMKRYEQGDESEEVMNKKGYF